MAKLISKKTITTVTEEVEIVPAASGEEKGHRYLTVGGYDDITDQIDAIRDEKQRLLLEDAEKEGARQQLKMIGEFLDGQQEEVEEYDEALVRKLIEKITVYDDRLVVEFKSGLGMDVGM